MDVTDLTTEVTKPALFLAPVYFFEALASKLAGLAKQINQNISSPICSYKFYTIPYTPGIVEFTGSPEKEISAGICCYLSMISKKSEEEHIDYSLWADILWDCCA